jgi:nucleotide-binding universal stress UspA family protein
VDRRILSGDAADTILTVVGEEQAALIAMATHGRSGVRHWVLGSVAEEVLHRATVPLLLVRGHHEPQ